MGISIQRDSDGNEFQILAQRQLNSCAAAVMWMAECEAEQMTINETEWDKALQIYQGLAPNTAPMSIDPTQHQNSQSSFENQFSRFGTYASQLAAAMQSRGLTVNSVHDSIPPPSLRLNLRRISQGNPVAILLGWWSNAGGVWTRNGGHFVLAVRVTRRGRIVYLDPWGGKLVELPNNGIYQGNGRLETALYVTAG